MDDSVQNGLQSEQWLSAFEKGEKRTNSLGSGALRFIRTRSSIRRELKRQCNRNKSSDSHLTGQESNSGGGGGGGLGKWLREHLGGGGSGSRASHESPSKVVGNVGNGVGHVEKSFGKAIYTSQNLYCSLPREHSRYNYSARKSGGHGGPLKAQGHDRQRSSSVNHHEKTTLADLGTLTRGGPIYGSEGKTMKKRNRDRRRHSLNESNEQTHQCRRSGSHEDVQEELAKVLAREQDKLTQAVPYTVSESRLTKDAKRRAEKQLLGSDSDSYYGEEAEAIEGYDDEEKRKLEEEEAKSKAFWDAVLRKHCDEGDTYQIEELGEEEGPIVLSPTSSILDKSEDDEQRELVREGEELTGEVLDRRSILDRVRKAVAERNELKSKNQLLEMLVARCMKKAQEQMIPADEDKEPEEAEQTYREALRAYKLQVDEIMARQAQLNFELRNDKDKRDAIHDEDDQVFKQYFDCLGETAVGLTYAKTGRKLTEKAVNDMINRQRARRKQLSFDRYTYILLQHRLEDLHSQLRSLEVLGEGMTTMDYEALRITNINYKDRLDERNQELEKLQAKIAEVINGVSHYKEKEICMCEDIEFEEEKLDEYRERAAEIRGHVNDLRVTLMDLRQSYQEKKRDAGFLVAQPELREMERTMGQLDTLRDDIDEIELEIQQYVPHKTSKKDRIPRLGSSLTARSKFSHSSALYR